MLLEAVVSLRLAINRLVLLERKISMTKRLKGDLDEDSLDKMLTSIRRLQYILESLALRLETMATTNVFSVEDLAVIRYVLRELREDYRNTVPGLEALIDDVLTTIMNVVRETRLEIPSESSPHITQAAREILKKAEEAVPGKSRGDEKVKE